ncbi:MULTISPECIES: hypothetical protein [unclassified Rhodococcus (in: high G+C Gram-positive bacteria)]|uniref:hypothetical protein n=1 Tax=unclassified Rhodococcus (in: high G+C Gram-positive bacteria) TaxID=192944 RepID=UPI001FF9F690|nr:MULTISPECIES: hypothetical protein [unclassified Rhodococcus (in: high G+C Gram-positive bacteria)]
MDTARLEGDVSAVDAAFSADSERFPDGVMASCAYAMDPPAGLWFLNEAGEAFRLAWPASPCELQNAPLDALADLTEVSRSSHPTGYNDRYNTVCAGSSLDTGFETTTPDDVAAAEERQRTPDVLAVPSLVMPVDDVNALQLCTYSASSVEQPPDTGISMVGSRTTLNRLESAATVRAVANAPFAPACDRTSTRITSTELRRPDGSGQSLVSFELDGCQRASGFGYYRTIPADVLSVLTRVG